MFFHQEDDDGRHGKWGGTEKRARERWVEQTVERSMQSR